LKTTQERFEDEKRTLSSQLAAKLVSCQNTFEQNLRKKEEHERSLITAILSESSKYCDISLADPIAAVSKLCHQFAELSQTRSQYLQFLDDFMTAQELLEVETGQESVTGAVHRVLNELNDVKAQNLKLKEAEELFKIEQTRLQTELRNAQNHGNAANYWTIWARRIHGLVYRGRSSSLQVEELRSSLEEAILLSITHRSFLFKIELLREQKKAFLVFDRAILFDRPIQTISFRTMILILLVVRRMQQLAGCVPLGIGPSHLIEQKQSSGKKKRKASGPYAG
jgi:hypothetical protein